MVNVDKMPLRIAIISTPRSGNTWLRLMLGRFYDAAQFAVFDPSDFNWDTLPENNCIMQFHWHHTDEFVEVLHKNNFRVVVLARNPLDVLISILHFSQNEPLTNRWLKGENGGEEALCGRTPVDPEFAAYAKGQRAASLLAVSYEWAQDPNVKIIKYEEMVAKPEQTLYELFREFGWPDKDVSQVIQEHSIQNLRPFYTNQHFWQGEPGLWKKLIPRAFAGDIADIHSAVFAGLRYTIDEAMELSREAINKNWEALSICIDEPERQDNKGCLLLERKTINLGDHTVFTELHYGPKIFLDTRDTGVAQNIILYGYWEKWVTDVFLSLLKPGMVVLDIGANCGYYSLLAAQAVGPSGTVHCVEPYPFLHKNLTRSFLFNGYSHVKLHKVAFSDQDGEINLYLPGNFSGAASIDKTAFSIFDDYFKPFGDITAIKVPAVKLATYFPNLKADVIKIDIQGAEPLLVDGLLKIAENSGNLDILMEYSPTLWVPGSSRPEEILAQFTSNNFSIVILERNGTQTKVSLDQLLSISKKLEESKDIDFVDLWLSRRV